MSIFKSIADWAGSRASLRSKGDAARDARDWPTAAADSIRSISSERHEMRGYGFSSATPKRKRATMKRRNRLICVPCHWHPPTPTPMSSSAMS